MRKVGILFSFDWLSVSSLSTSASSCRELSSFPTADYFVHDQMTYHDLEEVLAWSS